SLSYLYSHNSLHLSFSFSCYRPPRHLHSFPTRRSSDLFELAFLQGAQQLGLNLKWNVAHLIQKQRTLIGQFQPAKLLGNRTGKRSEEHTSELQSRGHLVCRLLLEKKKKKKKTTTTSKTT